MMTTRKVRGREVLFEGKECKETRKVRGRGVFRGVCVKKTRNVWG